MAVDGVKQLQKQLKQLSGRELKNVMRASVRAAAKVVVDQARANIPVGSKPHKTYKGVLVAPGFARRSIRSVVQFDRRTGSVSARIGVRAQAFYATQFIELEVGRSGRRGKPWLRPAFRSTEKQQLDAFRVKLRAAVARVRR